MSGAVLPLRIDFDPQSYEPHSIHATDRVWTETNCYVDLWVELLHALGHDPLPALASVFSAGFDGHQWTFLKPQPEDLRRLYGLDVAEINVWRPPLDLLIQGLENGNLNTIEIDSWWLPDTSATDYRTAHVKTTIVPAHIDMVQEQLTYFHNAGLHRLQGDDFRGAFALDTPSTSLVPYVEQIRYFPEWVVPDSWLSVVQEHFGRRAPDPVRQLAESVHDATKWLPEAGPAAFHSWAFGTLRQCGASAELAADLCDRLTDHGIDVQQSAILFRAVASLAKVVQFKMARVALGRKGEVTGSLETMTAHWNLAMDQLAHAMNERATPVAG